VLRRTADGGYRYESAVIAAHIEPDGTLCFDSDPMPPQRSEEPFDERDLHRSRRTGADDTDYPGKDENVLLPALDRLIDAATTHLSFLRLSLLTGSLEIPLDLEEMAMRAMGDDPRRAEREWLVRVTETLRVEMHATHRARRDQENARHLRGQLLCLWEDEGVPGRERRRLIFQLWDNASSDEVGEQARTVIETFVREALPASSPHAYSDTELETLNRQRRSRRPFQPYAA
jgi:hypothetical protein